eukprot:6192712-Pyramimonas_sp.AAC.2
MKPTPAGSRRMRTAPNGSCRTTPLPRTETNRLAAAGRRRMRTAPNGSRRMIPRRPAAHAGGNRRTS